MRIIGLSALAGVFAISGYLFTADCGCVPVERTINFSSGVRASESLPQVVSEMLGPIEAIKDPVITITGHTYDGSGDEAAESALSLQRAEKVHRAFLVGGVNGEWIVRGLGASDPLPQGKHETKHEYERRLSRVTVRAE